MLCKDEHGHCCMTFENVCFFSAYYHIFPKTNKNKGRERGEGGVGGK